MTALGERFARALAAKDADALRAVLAPDLDFRALTPNRFWEAASADDVVDDVLLGQWLSPGARVDALEDVATGSVADRERVTYLLRVTNPDGTYLVEQTAYYATAGDRITSLRVICSGYRPVSPSGGA